MVAAKTGQHAVRHGGPRREWAATLLEKAAAAVPELPYRLRLYITDRSPRSLRAMINLRRICDEQLGGQCRVEVIDLLKYPFMAKEDGILAVPTLIRRTATSVRRVIGDLSDTSVVLSGLDLVAAAGAA